MSLLSKKSKPLRGLCLNIIMDWTDRLVQFMYRTRNRTNRARRLLFPSPAELRLIELLGGRVVRFTKLQDPRTHFPAAIIVSMGKTMRAERVRREVKLCGYYVDFANDLKRIIEVDGAAYHTDVVADMEREINIRARHPDARILRITAKDIHRKPAQVRAKVLSFLD